ncbi:DUF1716-domain-containing protein [Sodiomyces alkalinus F11]|uniref:DUF1716-domain-containing protein n=1 Tax=Sodiomyces alkalinus (strain CBS 110278 / VKM F-3762 / F11) TaxID=1314773 RepID=A0A3N2Q2D5_SODAK|nr:DUF1716-domain-containing protein [Sodiomyces alkalinus F11]ROT40931.1 DUF1716-domain-containing protein [Sodiomyces alkalinus F11]
MTSVDELFKNVGSSGKRKLDPVRDPNEIYKSAKLSASDRNSRHDRVANENEDVDMEAGPAPPPTDEGDTGDYGPEPPPDEDDEGRFFGGGVSREQVQALDFVEARGDDAALSVEIGATWLRKTALVFEKLINKNAELRAKYEQEPQKFIASEADLDAAIKEFSILSEHTDLWPELVKLGTVTSLVGLLAHDNTDIAISTVQMISELTADDVESTEDDWNKLVDAMLEADLIGLLVSNLKRLDESDETDAGGVYHVLSVVENTMSRPAVAQTVGLDDALLRWLLDRVQRKEEGVSAGVTQNRQYSAELLAIISQVSAATRRKLVEMDVVDVMLQLAAPYRRRDPEKGGEEEEYVQNLFETLVSLVDEPEGKTKFLEAEGIELCVLMLRDSGSKMNKLPTVRLLNHAVSGFSATQVCQKLVEAGGLKPLFSLFMKRHDHRIYVDLLLGIFAWMLQLLPAESPERIRTQAKFVEKKYQKTVQLAATRRRFAEAVEKVEAEFRRTMEQMDESERETLAGEDYSLLERIDAGLYTLQYIDIILAWLAAEDSGARGKIRELLAEQGKSLDDIKMTLQAHLDKLDPEAPESRDWQEMLGALIHAI